MVNQSEKTDMFSTTDTKSLISVDLYEGPHIRLILYYEGLYFNYTDGVRQSVDRDSGTLRPSLSP